MVPPVEELSAAIGMMEAADRMLMRRMRMPVQTPAPVDVAVVRPPVHADARDDPEQDPDIEDAGIEPVPRAAGVQPLKRKEAREEIHQFGPINPLASAKLTSSARVSRRSFRMMCARCVSTVRTEMNSVLPISWFV